MTVPWTFRLGASLAVVLLLAAPFAAAEDALTPLTPQTESPPPPYDEGFLRLSEILGAIHYLRDLCGASEGALWRYQMQALIDSENPQPDRKARFIDRFNLGYESFKAVYTSCTPAAIETIDRYMAEGAKIARDISARYGKSE